MPQRRSWLLLAFLWSGIAAARAADFPDGVAVGDVTDSAAVFWTRADAAGPVRLEVARDATFQTLERTADATADAGADFTVRIELTGLAPATNYFYRFVAADASNAISATGRFHTAPPPDQAAALRFVFSGDTHFGSAPFRIAGDAARENADLFLWFGDTIYGDAAAGGLGPAKTLADYRAKYRQVRSDPHIRDILSGMAVYAGWDDHEVENDYAGLDPAVPAAQRDAGYRAFFEYLPVRDARAANDPFRTYRRLRYGAQVEFFFIDGRQYREPSAAAACGGNPDPQGVLVGPLLDDPECVRQLRGARTMLGQEQYDWLLDGLRTSTARVKFVVNNVPLSYLVFAPYDRWDGYDNERRGLLEFIDGQNITGVIFLTTDIHANAYNPDVTRYFRARRADYHLPNGVAVPEVIVGPLGNESQYEEVLEFAPQFLRGSPLGFQLLDGAYFGAVRGLQTINGLSFVDPNRISYVVVDVSPEGGVKLEYRGLHGADAQDTSRPIETFFAADVEPPPPLTAVLPCGLPVFLFGGTLYFLARCCVPPGRKDR